MDRILKEERKYIVNLVKQIVATGCNVLLIQKSILRDAVNECCPRERNEGFCDPPPLGIS